MDEKPKSRASAKAKPASKKAAPKAARPSQPTNSTTPSGPAQPDKGPGPAPAAKGRRPSRHPAGKLDLRTFRLGLAALLLVVAVVLGGVAIFGGDSGGSQEASSQGGGEQTNAVALSEEGLVERVRELGRPVFWIGPRAGTESYELSSTADGSVYVRYLTAGAKAGEEKADFITVGTYPVPEAAKALRHAAAEEGNGPPVSRKGFEILASPEATSAYVVFDDEPDIQVELFSPQPGEADQLARAGTLVQVE